MVILDLISLSIYRNKHNKNIAWGVNISPLQPIHHSVDILIFLHCFSLIVIVRVISHAMCFCSLLNECESKPLYLFQVSVANECICFWWVSMLWLLLKSTLCYLYNQLDIGMVSLSFDQSRMVHLALKCTLLDRIGCIHVSVNWIYDAAKISHKMCTRFYFVGVMIDGIRGFIQFSDPFTYRQASNIRRTLVDN